MNKIGTQSMKHITVNTGHSVTVPKTKVWDSTASVLRPQVLAGGGQLLPHDGRYVFLLNSEDPSSCGFSIWRMRLPVVFCIYQELSNKAEARWQTLCDSCSSSSGQAVAALRKPAEPWLGVVLYPTAFLAGPDLRWIASAEQCIAETWRRLPGPQRYPISWSEELAEMAGLVA